MKFKSGDFIVITELQDNDKRFLYIKIVYINTILFKGICILDTDNLYSPNDEIDLKNDYLYKDVNIKGFYPWVRARLMTDEEKIELL